MMVSGYRDAISMEQNSMKLETLLEAAQRSFSYQSVTLLGSEERTLNLISLEQS